MTVTTETRSVTYEGDNSAYVFPFTFPVFKKADLKLTLTNTTVSPTTEFVINSANFDVAFNADATGSITYPNNGDDQIAPGFFLKIERWVPFTQTLKLPTGSTFTPKVMEERLDRNVMQTQQLHDIFDQLDTDFAGLQSQFESGIVPIEGFYITDSISALVNLNTTLFSGTFIYVLSWHSGLRKGGGWFQHDAADTTSTDNSGTIIVDDDGRRWKRLNVSQLDVFMFGAKGDGATDDHAAFVNCFSAAEDFAFVGNFMMSVLVPAAKYHLSAMLELYFPNVTQAMIYAAGAVVDNTVWIGTPGVSIFGLTVDGARGSGFMFHRGQGSLIINCTAQNCLGFGFMIGGGYRDQVAWMSFINCTSIENIGGLGASIHGGTDAATPVTGSAVIVEPVNEPSWGNGYTYALGTAYAPDGTYYAPATGGTGTGAIMLITVISGSAYSELIHGGQGYTAGDALSFDRTKALTKERTGMSSGSGHGFLIETVSTGESLTQEKAWMNAVNYDGFFIRENSHWVITFSENGNINYNNYRGLQVEANTPHTIPLWTGVCNGSTIEGCHFAGGTGLDDTVKMISFTTGSTRNKILGGRFIHASSTADTKFEDLMDVGTNAVVDTVAQGVGPLYYYGLSASASNYATGGLPADIGTYGSNVGPVVTEMYVAEVSIIENCVVTGVSVLIGSAAAGDWKALLYDVNGRLIANTASIAQAGTNVYVQLPFTANLSIIRGTYFIGIKLNDTAGRFRAHTFGAFKTGVISGITFGTNADMTPPTGFTVSRGPIASLY